MVVEQTAIDSLALEALFQEIATYLAVVDAFRREGVDPRWAPEGIDGLPSEGGIE
jgi:hypothetical protein